MKPKRTLLILTTLTLLAATAGVASAQNPQETACSYPFTSQDATGTNVTMNEPPSRIVSLAPSAAQTLWEIGAKDRVVGLTPLSYYLPGAMNRTDVSAPEFGVYNYERIVTLNPDVVLAPNVIPESAVTEIRSLGIKTYRFREANDLEDIYDKTILTGRIAGECSNASQTVADMKHEVRIVRNTVDGAPQPTFLYLLDKESRFTAGNNTFINTVITSAGGSNLAVQKNISGYKPVSDEVVATNTVEYLVLPEWMKNPPRTPAYNQTDAVLAGKVIYVNNDYINQPAPRTVEVLGQLARAFHPARYLIESIEANNPTNPDNDGGGGGGDGPDSPEGTANGTRTHNTSNTTNQQTTQTPTQTTSAADSPTTDSTDDTTTQDTASPDTENQDDGTLSNQENTSQQRSTDGQTMIPLLLATAASLIVFLATAYRYIRPQL